MNQTTEQPTFAEQQKTLREERIKQLELRQAHHWQPLESAGQIEPSQRELWESEKRELETLKAYKEPPPAPAPLVQTVKLGNYLSRALNNQPIDGAERELLQELKIDTHARTIPLAALLEPRAAEPAETESRSEGATSLTLGEYSTQVMPVLDSIFKSSDSDFLGVEKPMMAHGEARFPVITTAATADAVEKSATQAPTAVGFSVEMLNPTSVRSHVVFSYEDEATWGNALLESALKANMRRVISETIDNLIINGNAASPDFDGVLDKIPSGKTDADPSDALNWSEYRDFVIKTVDGKLAGSEEAARLLVGVSTWHHMRSVFRSDSIDSLDAVDEIKRLTSGSIKASAHLPAAASNVQKNLAVTEGMAAVCPMWSSVSIRDVFSNADDGEVRLVLNHMIAFDLLRSDGWWTRKSYIA